MSLEGIVQKVRKKAIALGIVGALSLGTAGMAYGQQNPNPIQKDLSQKHLFACETYDLNKTSPVLSREEKVFNLSRDSLDSNNVSVILVGYDPDLKAGDQEIVYIGDSSGKIRSLHVSTLKYDKQEVIVEVPQVLLEGYGYGTYKVYWASNDVKELEASFTISPKE